ncbi:MAG: LrgB family protein [Tissierellaceae bacterium]|nr:LrgB family protein [Tissierellaceae bacterium]
MALTLIAYLLSVKLKEKFKLTILNPILVSSILIIIILVIFNIDYGAYNEGGKYISFLLTPATVCLAIPLYQQLESLKKSTKAIMIGISTGVITSLLSVSGLSILLNLDRIIYVSILPKSITTAIAIGITEELGGVQALTILSLLVTGITGNVIGEYICKLFRIKNPIAVGLAIGTSSHAIGTSKALEIGEVEGAMSSLSIAIAGLLTVALAPIVANFILL